jgi:MinD superfamily P-loop ATPase
MRISVASGKGGTGKTTVATNLARVLYEAGVKVAFLDCDVEEPNAHIFLNPQLYQTEPVLSRLPVVDQDKCTGCKKCVEFCLYNALALVGKKVLVFPELCHACGGCSLVCPTGAISEVEREIGVVEMGYAYEMPVLDGVLEVGEAIAPPIIKAVKRRGREFESDVTIIDAPPGTACPMIEAIKGSDYCILVTEPTPFGLNDLKLAIEVVCELKIPHGVVINRCDIGDRKVEGFCDENGIPILMRIPMDRRIAEAYSEGVMMLDVDESWRGRFLEMFEAVKEAIG